MYGFYTSPPLGAIRLSHPNILTFHTILNIYYHNNIIHKLDIFNMVITTYLVHVTIRSHAVEQRLTREFKFY